MLNTLNKASKSCKLKTRDNIIEWMQELLSDPFEFNGKTGCGYSQNIQEFEYISRQLWGIFALIASGDYDQDIVQPYIERIKLGIDMESEYAFPVPTTKTRQIAVEMAVYGFGLLSCQKSLLQYFDEGQIIHLSKWLNKINDIEFPLGNWLFFLLIVNYGLKKNGLDYNQERINYATQKIEEFYIGGGWYQDGHPSQRDYYIPFAFHFYSLIIKKYCPEIAIKDIDERCSEFENDYVDWMDNEGRTIPFGRSLTYRFAHSSYWSACVLSDTYHHEIGIVKSMIFNNLNFWKNQDILQDGILSIGYGYPNLILSEDYNAPGSPMWAMKTFLILSLPSSHPFWSAEEKSNKSLEDIYSVSAAGFIIVTGKNHHYALSAGQYSRNKILQHMSKYGKFCYSTAFGWNLSRDVQGIQNFAVDNVLALSIKGTQQFISRGEIRDYQVHENYIYSCWNYETIASIESWLIPINEEYHIRLHRVHTKYALETYEGSYPVFGWNYKFDKSRKVGQAIDISKGNMTSGIEDLFHNRECEVVLQNPNTNIYNCDRNAIPVLKGELNIGVELYGCIVYGQLNQGHIKKLNVSFHGNCIEIENKQIFLKEL